MLILSRFGVYLRYNPNIYILNLNIDFIRSVKPISEILQMVKPVSKPMGSTALEHQEPDDPRVLVPAHRIGDAAPA